MRITFQIGVSGSPSRTVTISAFVMSLSGYGLFEWGLSVRDGGIMTEVKYHHPTVDKVADLLRKEIRRVISGAVIDCIQAEVEVRPSRTASWTVFRNSEALVIMLGKDVLTSSGVCSRSAETMEDAAMIIHDEVSAWIGAPSWVPKVMSSRCQDYSLRGIVLDDLPDAVVRSRIMSTARSIKAISDPSLRGAAYDLNSGLYGSYFREAFRRA